MPTISFLTVAGHRETWGFRSIEHARATADGYISGTPMVGRYEGSAAVRNVWNGVSVHGASVAEVLDNLAAALANPPVAVIDYEKIFRQMDAAQRELFHGRPY